MKKIRLFLIIISLSFFCNFAIADVIKKIEIFGNERISDETIIMFSNIQLNEKFNIKKSNSIIKELYESNFFEDVSVKYEREILTITVKELPIIDSIVLKGVKAQKFEESIRDAFVLKPRSSFNKFLLSKELKSIKSVLKKYGYYFSKVDVYIEDLDNNMVNINYYRYDYSLLFNTKME